MPVIINEFEIITEAPQPEPVTAAPATTPDQPQPLRPEEVMRITQRQVARVERVRAD